MPADKGQFVVRHDEDVVIAKGSHTTEAIQSVNGLPRPHYVRPRNDVSQVCRLGTPAQQEKVFRHAESNPILQSFEKEGVKEVLSPRERVRERGHSRRGKRVGFTLAEGATHVVTLRKYRKFAFTLAEILITLGIIGVVAALTMPSIITKYQKNVAAEQLKKTYSILSNAAKRSELETGEEARYWQYPAKTYDLDFIPFFQKHYIPYLNVAEECISANCFTKEHYYIENNIGGFLANYIVKLNDGTWLSFLPGVNAGYLWVFADINGKKGPNREGRDVFVLNISPSQQGKSVRFYGSTLSDTKLKTNPDYGCSKALREASSSNYIGHYCGELIMRNGWKIPDDADYPW